MSAASTVLRNIRASEVLAARQRDVASQKVSEAVALWHDRPSGAGSKEAAKAEATMAEDLASASEAVVVVRRERLRALYAAERVQFQTELRARGLAMQTAE